MRWELRSETFGVSGEETCPADVTEAKKEHDDAFEADTAAGVGRTRELESVQITLHLPRLDLRFSHSFHEQSR